MKLSKRGAFTLLTVAFLLMSAYGILAIKLYDVSSKYDEQTAQMSLLKEEYNSINSELNSEKEERTKYQSLYDHLSVENNQLKEELNN